LLVGRERELEKLNRYLDMAIKKGHGKTVFVSGEAGSGKTRLVNELLALTRKSGIDALSGWCLSNSAVPYFPFFEALNSYSLTTDPNGSRQLEVKTWLQGCTDEDDGFDIHKAEHYRDRTFSSIVKELLYLSAKKPIILFIDDIHWADSASLSLLHYLAKALSNERILILATFRSEEVSSQNTPDKYHSLTETLRLMGREDLFAEIKLTKLSQSNIGKLAEDMLGGKVDENFIGKLMIDSGGNPLFVVESIRMMYEHGKLAKLENYWCPTVATIEIPNKFFDIMKRRFNFLNQCQKRTLNAASIIGEKFNPQLLAHILNQEKLEALELLNSIEESGRLVLAEGDYYKFEHAKIREMVYNQMPFLIKQELHSKTALTMELEFQNNKFAPSDIAYHFEKAGNIGKAIEYNLLAGKDALAKYSNAEAATHFSFVSKNKDKITKDEMIAALEGLGDSYYANMLFKEAAKTYEELAEIEDTNRLRALRKAMEAYFFQNDLFHLEMLLEEADKCVKIDRLENARILHNKARVCTLKGHIELGIEFTSEALKVFEEECALWDVAWDSIALGCTLPHLGKNLEGVAALLRSAAIFSELNDYRWLIESWNYIGMFLALYCGYQKEGTSFIRNAINVNKETKLSDYLRLSQSYIILSWIHSSENPEEALTEALQALTYAEKTDSYWAQGTVYSHLTTLYFMRGQTKEAELFYDKLKKLPEIVHKNVMVNMPLATAHYYASKNQYDKATAVLKSVLSQLEKSQNIGSKAIFKLSYAFILSKQGNIQEAKKQWEETQQLLEKAKTMKNPNIITKLMAPIRVTKEQTVEARLDIINISNSQLSIVSIDNLLPSIQPIACSNGYKFQDNLLVFEDNTAIGPFEVRSIKFSFKSSKNLELTPKVNYLSSEGNPTIAMPIPLQITVVNAIKPGNEQVERVEFPSLTSKKVFDYLVGAFIDDYQKRRLTQENSGWKTLMNIADGVGLSKNRLYGSSGRHGKLLRELEHMGLVDTRVFVGERGRGGKILKTRIAYEKPIVKDFLSQSN
jgi:predicted ATPase